jgi:glycine/D-amino acid oxidase-like deaminating enzyme
VPTAWPDTPPTAAERAAYAEAVPRPFWLERRTDPVVHPALDGRAEADLCIVGGGFTGLWAAVHAKTRDPDRNVILVEGDAIGEGASGRNGGFLSSSITHGIGNGVSHFPDEVQTLERLGLANFDGLRADLDRLGIDCDFEASGEIAVAVEPHQVAPLAEEAELLRTYGHDVELLDADGIRAGTRIDSLERDGAGVRLAAAGRAEVRARRALLATNAFPPLRRALRRYIVPVYDYVLVSEPLTAEQLESLGWRNRQGISDTGHQFHYYRLTDDNRILWGGFEAVYRFGGPVDPSLDVDEETFALLSQHFFATFPQLRGLRFTHKWGGAIDTCSRFSVFFDTSHDGRVAFAGGYTGLGVGSSRFGAAVALDLLDGRHSEATDLGYVRSKPVPVPPEPLRWAVVQLTRGRLAAADR